jgi:soluble lytic murein transglycosylase-like protein
MAFFESTARLGLSSPYDAAILAASGRYVVDPALIKAVISKESSWNPNAYRAEPQIGDASRGLMQILYRTAQGIGYVGSEQGLFDPATNIDFGTKFLAEKLNQYGYPAGVSAYNAGRPITGNAQYVADVDAYYTFFILNDPILAPAPGGAGPTWFPRAAGVEWHARYPDRAARRP